MKTNIMLTNIATAIILMGVAFACENSPKVISESQKIDSKNSSGVFSNSPIIGSNAFNKPATRNDLHTVKVMEVLSTSKYNYINVTENGNPFWIAARKQDVVIGETYFYKGGLLKTNYESKEVNKIFEKIYLVTNMVPLNHANQLTSTNRKITKPKEISSIEDVVSTKSKQEKVGIVKISELIKNPAQYEGKTIKINGECTKVNPNIMNRNWIHLDDGTTADFDLVITSNAMVTKGQKVVMEGKVILNKDFGSGYQFDIILEDGKIIE